MELLTVSEEMDLFLTKEIFNNSRDVQSQIVSDMFGLNIWFNERHTLILNKRMSGETFKKIGIHLNISSGRVGVIYKKIIKRLRHPQYARIIIGERSLKSLLIEYNRRIIQDDILDEINRFINDVPLIRGRKRREFIDNLHNGLRHPKDVVKEALVMYLNCPADWFTPKHNKIHIAFKEKYFKNGAIKDEYNG